MQSLTKLMVATSFVALLNSCGGEEAELNCKSPGHIERQGPPGVVVNGAALVAAPDKYAGSVVITTGYVGYLPGDAEQFAVYMDEQDLRYGWYAGAIALELMQVDIEAARSLVGHRVTVEGKFGAVVPPVPSENFPFGVLQDVTQLSNVEDRFSGRAQSCSPVGKL